MCLTARRAQSLAGSEGYGETNRRRGSVPPVTRCRKGDCQRGDLRAPGWSVQPSRVRPPAGRWQRAAYLECRPLDGFWAVRPRRLCAAAPAPPSRPRRSAALPRAGFWSAAACRRFSAPGARPTRLRVARPTWLCVGGYLPPIRAAQAASPEGALEPACLRRAGSPWPRTRGRLRPHQTASSPFRPARAAGRARACAGRFARPRLRAPGPPGVSPARVRGRDRPGRASLQC